MVVLTFSFLLLFVCLFEDIYYYSYFSRPEHFSAHGPEPVDPNLCSLTSSHKLESTGPRLCSAHNDQKTANHQLRKDLLAVSHLVSCPHKVQLMFTDVHVLQPLSLHESKAVINVSGLEQVSIWCWVIQQPALIETSLIFMLHLNLSSRFWLFVILSDLFVYYFFKVGKTSQSN